ncbi:MAG: hypothetical protein R8G66_07855 [Cytophagales bacterium]|nr:hypothetical protein [Cytophagales bacterium]
MQRNLFNLCCLLISTLISMMSSAQATNSPFDKREHTFLQFNGPLGLVGGVSDPNTININNANNQLAETMLWVGEGIVSNKLCVFKIPGWADYVFDPAYKTPSLSDVEEFLSEHKHLPGIPSEEEVKEHGYSPSELYAAYLAKIEELTLLTIDRQSKLEALKAGMPSYQVYDDLLGQLANVEDNSLQEATISDVENPAMVSDELAEASMDGATDGMLYQNSKLFTCDDSLFVLGRMVITKDYKNLPDSDDEVLCPTCGDDDEDGDNNDGRSETFPVVNDLNPEFLLYINGGTTTYDYICRNLHEKWGDYVFEDSYPLMSLESLSTYVSTNRHLPGIPSEAEVMANGLELSEMTGKFIVKIEELFLYLLQQDEEIRRIQAWHTPEGRDQLIVQLADQIKSLKK